MQIISQNKNNKHTPLFTAHLKGSALRFAVKNAKDSFQLGEISEIITNVKYFGDQTTIIDCNADGFVSVCNDKFGNIVHKYNLIKNDKSDNPYLDLIRNFNSDNGVMKVEYKLLDYVFEHSKNLTVKQAKYKLYSSMPLSSVTKVVLDTVAKKHNVIEASAKNIKSTGNSNLTFDKLKEMILKSIGN